MRNNAPHAKIQYLHSILCIQLPTTTQNKEASEPSPSFNSVICTSYSHIYLYKVGIRVATTLLYPLHPSTHLVIHSFTLSKPEFRFTTQVFSGLPDYFLPVTSISSANLSHLFAHTTKPSKPPLSPFPSNSF